MNIKLLIPRQNLASMSVILTILWARNPFSKLSKLFWSRLEVDWALFFYLRGAPLRVFWAIWLLKLKSRFNFWPNERLFSTISEPKVPFHDFFRVASYLGRSFQANVFRLQGRFMGVFKITKVVKSVPQSHILSFGSCSSTIKLYE